MFMSTSHSRLVDASVPFRRACVASALALSLVVLCPIASAAPLAFVPWRADHHMHLRSQAGYDALVAMCARYGDCTLPKPGARPASEAIASLDGVGAEKGVVLSLAFYFGSPAASGQHYDVARMTRAENEYIAQQVATYPERLVGFFSVDPLSANALDEVGYWAQDGRLKGLKLHFANSDVHLLKPEEVKLVAAVVGLAGEKGLPMVIHLGTSADFSTAEAESFIRDILPRAGGAWVQIAHAGTFGGEDKVNLNSLNAFAAHIAHHDPATRHVLFDISEAVTEKTTADDAAALVAVMRKIGLSRFLPGSDFDGRSSKTADELFREKLPLSAAEWRTVARNCAPWVCKK
jgi:predicted TIM-barrel fold metal-dependent hydrolase